VQRTSALPRQRLQERSKTNSVDARGVITHQTGAFTEETLVADVRPVRVPTVYGTIGDWFQWGATLISLSLLLLHRIRK
jgi:apolipoprotein N-acyltransferase